jgi:hypothetical protein
VFTSADCFFCDLILDSIRRRGRRELGENKPFYHSPIDRIVQYQTMINRQLYQAINRRKTAPEVHGLSFSLRDLA